MMAYFLNIILCLFLIILIAIGSLIFPFGVVVLFEQQKQIKTFFCPCKYNGPYEGIVLDSNTGKPVENSLVIFWWVEKRRIKGKGFFYEVKKIYKTFTNSNGFFNVPKYPEVKNPYTCPPSFFIYKEGYISLNFRSYIKNKEIKCFKGNNKCIFYLNKIEGKDEGKYNNLLKKSLPLEILKELKI
jgi:hypothetical protein